MRVIAVVVIHPFVSQQPQLFQIFEQVGIQYILSEQPVKTFNKSIPQGLTRLDVQDADIVPLVPFNKDPGTILWSMIAMTRSVGMEKSGSSPIDQRVAHKICAPAIVQP